MFSWSLQSKRTITDCIWGKKKVVREGLFEEVTWEPNPKSRVEISQVSCKGESNVGLKACAKAGGREVGLKESQCDWSMERKAEEQREGGQGPEHKGF